MAPPQNLEAEQSVLGAVLLSDTALPALIIDESLQPADFYREATAASSGDARAPRRRRAGRRAHARRAPQAERASSTRSAAARRSTCWPARSPRSATSASTRGSCARTRCSAASCAASYEIQARVHSHEAPPRELVDLAERTILEVAHEDSRKDFRWISDVLDTETNKLAELSREGKSITGTASGFDDLDTITGGFQPGNLIILAARPSMGKCLAGSTLVYDPRTGGRRRIDDLVADIERGRDAFVASLGPDLRLRTSKVSAGLRSGVQPRLPAHDTARPPRQRHGEPPAPHHRRLARAPRAGPATGSPSLAASHAPSPALVLLITSSCCWPR